MRLPFAAFLTLALAVQSSLIPAHQREEAVDLLEARGLSRLGKKCSTSAWCGDARLFCNRSKCDYTQSISKHCYKDIGCKSGKCVRSQCVASQPRANGSWCNDKSQCTSDYCSLNTCKAKAVTRPKQIGAACAKSTECQSGLCEYSHCAAKKANGASCYKDVACISGFCKNKRSCASKSTATSTGNGSSSPTVTPSNPDSGTQLFSIGFEDGTFGSMQHTGDVRIGSTSGLSRSGQNYLEMRVSDSTPAQITQTGLTRRVVSKRQQGTITNVLGFWYNVQTLVSSAGASCTITTLMNGSPLSSTTVDSGTQTRVYIQSSVSQVGTVNSFAVSVSCSPGASATILVDDVLVVQTAQGTATTTSTATSPVRSPDSSQYPGTDIPMLSDSFVVSPGFEGDASSWRQSARTVVRENSSKSYEGVRYLEMTGIPGGNSDTSSSWDRYDNTGVVYDANNQATNIRGYRFQGSMWYRVDSFTSSDPNASCTIWFHMMGRTLFKEKIWSDVGRTQWRQVGATVDDDTLTVAITGGAIFLSLDCWPEAQAVILFDQVLGRYNALITAN